jgi:hypothetical protein
MIKPLGGDLYRRRLAVSASQVPWRLVEASGAATVRGGTASRCAAGRPSKLLRTTLTVARLRRADLTYRVARHNEPFPGAIDVLG